MDQVQAVNNRSWRRHRCTVTVQSRPSQQSQQSRSCRRLLTRLPNPPRKTHVRYPTSPFRPNLAPAGLNKLSDFELFAMYFEVESFRIWRSACCRRLSLPRSDALYRLGFAMASVARLVGDKGGGYYSASACAPKSRTPAGG